jgi:ech hydrogenase subunit D
MTGQTERNQNITTLTTDELLGFVQERKVENWRLGVMIANLTDEYVEVIYVFEKDNNLSNVRVVLPAEDPRVSSITLLYGYAFVYENEIHDLFGVIFDGLQLDFGGNYFVTAEKTPWNPLLTRVLPEAAQSDDGDGDADVDPDADSDIGADIDVGESGEGGENVAPTDAAAVDEEIEHAEGDNSADAERTSEKAEEGEEG